MPSYENHRVFAFCHSEQMTVVPAVGMGREGSVLFTYCSGAFAFLARFASLGKRGQSVALPQFTCGGEWYCSSCDAGAPQGQTANMCRLATLLRWRHSPFLGGNGAGAEVHTVDNIDTHSLAWPPLGCQAEGDNGASCPLRGVSGLHINITCAVYCTTES